MHTRPWQIGINLAFALKQSKGGMAGKGKALLKCAMEMDIQNKNKTASTKSQSSVISRRPQAAFVDALSTQPQPQPVRIYSSMCTCGLRVQVVPADVCVSQCPF
jgi:hypothetical protein